MLPSSSSRTYSAAGVRVIATDQLLAPEGRGQAQAVLEGAGDGADRDPRAPVLRRGHQRRLVHDADRSAAAR